MGIAAAFWALGGWCGSVPISVLVQWLLRHPHGPIPGGPPDPDPWRASALAQRIVGTVVGAVAGYAAWRFGTVPDTAPALGNALASGIFAAAASFVATDLYAFATAGSAARAADAKLAGNAR